MPVGALCLLLASCFLLLLLGSEPSQNLLMSGFLLIGLLNPSVLVSCGSLSVQDLSQQKYFANDPLPNVSCSECCFVPTASPFFAAISMEASTSKMSAGAVAVLQDPSWSWTIDPIGVLGHGP